MPRLFVLPSRALISSGSTSAGPAGTTRRRKEEGSCKCTAEYARQKEHCWSPSEFLRKQKHRHLPRRCFFRLRLCPMPSSLPPPLVLEPEYDPLLSLSLPSLSSSAPFSVLRKILIFVFLSLTMKGADQKLTAGLVSLPKNAFSAAS